ncbi:MAG: alcohol dehydrogenase catalytic domain-containing protein, partial [Chthoniobacterales bacterium]
MKAIRLTAIGSPLQEQQIDVPNIRERDVLVRIRAAGICHSDAHYRNGVSPVRQLPLILGHEVAGLVEKIGRSVKAVGVGERVCLHYLVTCGRCAFCLAGTEQ